MKKEKSIENLSEKLKLGEFAKIFGSKIIGGNRTLTIKEVTITAPKQTLLESEYNEDDNNDGDKPEDVTGDPPGNTGPWY
ncbi:hypothetical protein KRE40_10075 [Elizabethkingia meningoseptica]|uniref:hypothetical protein n=1 Tax=Elizabethkingia meningoseptica TaxID=238 RepID=UPI0022F14A95|nr:hypothetical protein [Elizabethkingia meningoseptica]EJK5327845.1 hypothetical protein [Elizabethkingia meningoseptica]MDE5436979.1 hypothetical protein [Elizabethkingia meningoseptica]MDE5449424.1 hypothetical protein [Elizabethkingia meningoseptica]MDE5466796.1 hypothetical protein [Elizabethkingia meningoseptica]MDE5473974.1 hypothetical protein [Elizabethkingia meningoseptica]